MTIDLEAITAIGESARAARETYVAAVQRVEAEKSRTGEWQQAQKQQLHARFDETMDELNGRFRKAREGRAEAPSLADRRTTDEQLLAEHRMDRVWQRAARLLDAGVEHSEIIADASCKGDVATLLALNEELPSYLVATSSREHAADSDYREQTANSVRAALDPVLAKVAGKTIPGVAASNRIRAAEAVAMAEREMDAARATAAGKFDAMKYAIGGALAAQGAKA